MQESPFFKRVNGLIQADPSLWRADQATSSGMSSLAELFAHYGVYLQPAACKGEQADQIALDRLLYYYWEGWHEADFDPLLKIFKTCTNTLRTWPTIVYEEYSEALTPKKALKEKIRDKDVDQFDAAKYRAIQLDPDNALGLAFYAEILADQQKWLQAEKYASQAVTLDPNSMDARRVYGYVLETLSQYKAAIEQYQRAAEIAPNQTFLYVRIGVNFREGIKNPDRALEYFERAARINSQLGVQNPLPYIEIARTYTQMGQFFIASRNAERALSLDNINAHTYGQLGIIFRRARNYEGAMPLLQCAVRGCTADENEMGKTDVQGLPRYPA